MFGLILQFDALLDRLTGREMLEMFARLRGIPSKKIPYVVNAVLYRLNLNKYADKMCGKYRYATLYFRGRILKHQWEPLCFCNLACFVAIFLETIMNFILLGVCSCFAAVPFNVLVMSLC